MAEEELSQLREWLEGPRDMTEGAALYRRFGTNLMLKRQFEVERTPMAREMLVNEIRKLAGVSELEMRVLPRRAAASTGSAPVSSPSQQTPKGIPESEKQKIRFRERFPFLASDSCPEVLKILVADMFTAYGKYRESFEALQKGDAQRLMAAECEAVVENYIEDRTILEELTFYKEKGTLLGRHPKVRATLHPEEEPDYMAMDVGELVKKLSSAQVNVSKATAALRNADTNEKREKAEERLERWRFRLETIRAAIELRKKN